MKIIERWEYELAYFESAVKHVSHKATGNLREHKKVLLWHLFRWFVNEKSFEVIIHHVKWKEVDKYTHGSLTEKEKYFYVFFS